MINPLEGSRLRIPAACRRGVLPGGPHGWKLAVGAGQDAHEVAAHALDVRGADHLGPLRLQLGVDLLDAAEQFLSAGGEIHQPLPPIRRVRAAQASAVCSAGSA